MEIAGRRRQQDRISKLGDSALGCILSFLPAKEAARAAALSRPWRHAFAGVHAVSLEEPDPDYLDESGGSPCSYCDHDDDVTPRFASTVVTAALLRVDLYSYSHEDASAVDHWVSYALSYAASPPAGLELALRLDREPLCSRPCKLRRSKPENSSFVDVPLPYVEHAPPPPEAQPSRKRSRSPSSDSSESEDTRPRRILGPSSDSSRFGWCKVDICGNEVSSAEELTKLRDFLLHQLASTKHLHLQSPRLGAGVDHDALVNFPAFTRLLHLELTGCLPHEGDSLAAVTAMSRILRHAPILEMITLVFHTAPGGHDDSAPPESGYHNPIWKLDAHQLRYNKHDVLAAPAVIIPCLRNRVREINLVNYQGGRAQRTLVKFLFCNASVLEKLYCGFARGPLWVQTKLKDEIQGWAMRK